MSTPATLAEFEAWRAENAPAHRVAGVDHAMWMAWCSRMMSLGRPIEIPVAEPAPPAPKPAACPAPDVVEIPAVPTPAEIPGHPADVPDAPAPEAPPAPADDAPAGPLIAYTDGSGSRAHMPCGAGVVVYDGDAPIMEASRHLGNGTNNHAELSAVRVALYITNSPDMRGRELVVRTDSQYTVDSLTREVDCEAHRPNAVLINGIRRAMRKRRVRFELVKGHSGVVGNERADELANLGRKRTPKAPEECA